MTTHTYVTIEYLATSKEPKPFTLIAWPDEQLRINTPYLKDKVLCSFATHEEAEKWLEENLYILDSTKGDKQYHHFFELITQQLDEDSLTVSFTTKDGGKGIVDLDFYNDGCAVDILFEINNKTKQAQMFETYYR